MRRKILRLYRARAVALGLCRRGCDATGAYFRLRIFKKVGMRNKTVALAGIVFLSVVR